LSSAPRSPPSAPANKLRRTAREITQRYDDALAQSGVAVTQLPILVALGSKGDLPMTILAEKLSLDRTTLTRNLRILEIRGLVQIVAHEEDARVHLASLTSRAHACWEKRALRDRDVAPSDTGQEDSCPPRPKRSRTRRSRTTPRQASTVRRSRHARASAAADRLAAPSC
jgi:DNA-binding MarR family transcriptional regulator